jgi:PAS domain S-box-containing protein
LNSNEYIKNLIEKIPLGIAITDKNGFIKNVNNALLDMFGYEIDELLNQAISNIFEGYKKVQDVLFSGNNIIDEEVYVNARKNKLRFNVSVYPILNSNKKIVDIVYIFNDIKRERKLASHIMDNHAIYTFDKIVSKDKNFSKLIEFAKKVADSKSTILIMGESGTGKEILAQSIHNYSNRKDEAFIAINSGAIPKSLIESELFGYEEGAFTGAKKTGQPGKFEIAHKGTIFLDEIGEMPLELQTRLLRVVEEGIVSRIGSTDQIAVDVRIIAASNKNLKEEVKKGNFREDLFYRLNVLPMTILPLRERIEDIPLLVEYFMKKISKRLNKKEVEITKEQMDRLMEYSWPGNVRELENLVEFIINLEYVPISLLIEKKTYKPIELVSVYNDLSLETMEKNHIIKVLKINNGNITTTAEALGISRNTLYRKIEKYGVDC